jgi:SAM-dependent methyltransferase
MNYELAYRVGFHPWEDAEEQPSFTESFAQQLDRIESARAGPLGRALDIGTGSGIWGIELARRGWEVTGVDLVGRALTRARARVRGAGVEMRLVEADVTALGGAELGSGYDLVLDTGTFHGLRPAERAAMGREVDALAGGDATVLLLGWEPRRRGPLPRGVDIAEVRAAFPGWRVEDAGPTGFEAPRPIELLLRPGERWYSLTRA